ncbi:glutaminyl-peptide cyclotransferase-like isoform X2 [Bacillus rossius redtenbacheri]
MSSLTNMTHFGDVLRNILIPRVVGTPNHERVKNYLVESMQELGWSVEQDSFKDTVPVLGELQFTNVVAKLNPDAQRFLMLACHYDSKYMNGLDFVGATDSAVPCAMMINLAYVMKDYLSSIKGNDHISLAFIFFDGEEAFLEWNATDSIYGARHLAQLWQNTPYPVAGTNQLWRMELLMLLDLLGASRPLFYSYFPNTSDKYNVLLDAEDRLWALNLFERYSPAERYFFNQTVWAGIEDDHLPFLLNGVPVLHIIPYTFPSVWHTLQDNLSVVNMTTCENLNKIWRIFVACYLHIDV